MKTRRQAEKDASKPEKQQKVSKSEGKKVKKPVAKPDPDPVPPVGRGKKSAKPVVSKKGKPTKTAKRDVEDSSEDDSPQKSAKDKSQVPNPDPVLKDMKRKKRKRDPSPDAPASPPTAQIKDTPVPDNPVVSPPPEEKLVRQIKKGSAAVDNECPYAKTHHVFEDQERVWTATLNQTDIKNNANKYYIIQMLQSDTNQAQFYVWNRWGRVGFPGQNAIHGPFSTADSAKTQFTKKLQDKTRGGYVELEIVYTEEEEKKAPDASAPTPKTDFPGSALDRRVQDLIKLIFDLNMINKALAEIGYDAKKMPLGKLSTATLKKGYEVLKKIEAVFNQTEVGNLDDLSSDFYSLIPHDFGFQHMSNFTIKTKQRLKEKIEMIESLAEMKIATTMLADVATDSNPIDEHYAKLHCGLKPIERESNLFKLLEEYVENTHAKTHSNYSLTILDAFEIDREGEDARFKKDIGNKTLLWHGSRLTNWIGILSQGLRIAPPEAPATGYMFGKGVYFADMVSKSANYCFTNRENNVGCMMLCEVALGECNELLHADYNASALPPGKSSTKGCGKTAPGETKEVDGVKVPCGKGVQTSADGGLLYNEFIVYDVAQVKMRYLFKMRFNYR